MRGIALFDIDNTLLYSGGAGTAAMFAAFADVYGTTVDGQRLEFDGRTDLAIFRDMLAAIDVDLDVAEPRYARFVETYLGRLESALVEKQGHLKPGLPQLLDALVAAGVELGITTGNLRQGAAHKLRHFGLHDYFPSGGYGDAVFDRAMLVRDAIGCFGPDAGARPIWVVGDTPADIASARANGVFAIGVATGSYTRAQLLECGADLAFADLSDVGGVVEALARLGG